ncbi:mitochondrial pyruvate carrier 2-like [Anneissia japonica]|uniref:mitochondrial pyruvate carrier 2-like n=1 Tax=Anneissia japonica TaxID=1529436 RepID=UPI0014258459|nr:mitochondrial pyruvate carrier 2-like [Anneissia japonica]XP_033105306.1 mitochondrial pyruvate carrier 2-like [Anneissia japonica]XP_033105307.1 mitochondrial pyruvate carrier 2-like [Anneissia japonica]
MAIRLSASLRKNILLTHYRKSGTNASVVRGRSSTLARFDQRIQDALPEKLRGLWNHPAGLKTIHFWAPSWKWALVIAGLADLARPPEALSVRQSGALAATGMIWCRYSLVIIPKNYNLFSVNFFLCLTGGIQLIRIYLYEQRLKKEAVSS